MADADTALTIRARRAYEIGRVLLGMRHAAAVVPMAALSLIACARPAATGLDAGLLAALVVLCEWRGASFGRGARIGLWAGVPPLLLPVLVQATGHLCGASFCGLYPAACLCGGIVGGALVGGLGVRRGLDTHGLAAAGVVAGLAGTLGCLLAGVGGLVGLIVGLGLGAAPVLALRRA